MNKYVMELPKTMSSNVGTVCGARTGKPVAKWKPRHTSSGASSSGPRSRTELPIHERKWIHVEPEECDAHSLSVWKKLKILLRHELPHLREETELSYSKIWRRCLFRYRGHLLNGQFEHGLITSRREEEPRKDSSAPSTKTVRKLFFTFEPFKVTRDELRSTLLCKTWW